MYFSLPTQSFGYYRGSPIVGGEGAGQGVEMAGQGVFSAGSGNAQGTAWNPTILYLFVLIIAEMFIFAFIARKL